MEKEIAPQSNDNDNYRRQNPGNPYDEIVGNSSCFPPSYYLPNSIERNFPATESRNPRVSFNPALNRSDQWTTLEDKGDARDLRQYNVYCRGAGGLEMSYGRAGLPFCRICLATFLQDACLQRGLSYNIY